MRAKILMTIAVFGLAVPANAADPVPVPLTRDDVKQALEDSKHATPRLPLPPPTEEEQKRNAETAKARAADAAARNEPPRRGGYGVVNNGRMRNLYLGVYNTRRGESGGFSREPDPLQKLDPAFRVMMFWIVSRGNNCTYCLGHQESGLGSRDVPEELIAALDADWSMFDPAKQAAFAFTKKVSFEPYAITDADVDALRKYYNDTEITELLLAISGFNAMNRWTGPLRITQESHREFLKPTAEKFATTISPVAPLPAGASGKGFIPPVARPRPALETPEQVQKALEAARSRTPRLKLADESATKTLLGDTIADAPAPQWMRLLAVFPKAGPTRIEQHLAAEQKGTLEPRHKAVIAYVGARNDRAWYALGHAIDRLKTLGFSDEQIRALDDPDAITSPKDGEIARFARKITVDPALIDDDDFARMRALFDDQKVAEAVYQITEAAAFDRLTETAGLQLEP
jgi:alkylhydroperoxidase family enzyme